MGWFVKKIILFALLLHYYFSQGASEIQDDLLIIDQLADFYNYDNIVVFVKDRQDRNLKKFLKTFFRKIQFIEVTNEEMLSTIIFDKKNKVYFTLCNDDDLTFKVVHKVLESNSTIFSKSIWFIKVRQKNKMAKKFGNRFKFDSNVNILSQNKENAKEITEIYSVKQNIEDALVITNNFGIWSNGKLIIKHPYIWERRTDFFGINLRLVFKSYSYNR